MMTTLPHPSAPREPLTTLVTELFGDQPTPASPLPASDHTADERWHDAVTQVGEQLRAKLRVEVLPDRLHKALALVLAHAVTLHSDGTASVQSGTQTYRLAPECPCADAMHRAELCKHSLAVELHRRALALLDGTAPASSPTAGSGSPRGRDAASQCRSTASSHATRRGGYRPGPPPQRRLLGCQRSSSELLPATSHRRDRTHVHDEGRQRRGADQPRTAPRAMGARCARSGTGAASPPRHPPPAA